MAERVPSMADDVLFRCSTHSSGLKDLSKKVTVKLITRSPTTVNELYAKSAFLVLHCSDQVL